MTKTSSRTQTTVNIAADALAALDELSRMSGVSRSKLIDLSVRRFARWAAALEPKDIRLIAEYEVTEGVTPQPVSTSTTRKSARPPRPVQPISGLQEAVTAAVRAALKEPLASPPASQGKPVSAQKKTGS